MSIFDQYWSKVSRIDREVLHARCRRLPLFKAFTVLVHHFVKCETGYANLTPGEKEFSDWLVRLLNGRPLFHGGTLGLKVGEKLLTPAVTLRNPRMMGPNPLREENVFFTPVLWLAEQFADRCQGTVYEVTPDTAVTVEPAVLRAITVLLDDPQFSAVRQSEIAMLVNSLYSRSATIKRLYSKAEQ